MLLRSYGFMEEVDPRVWSILADMPDQADCAVELAEASLDGRLDAEKLGVDHDPFNIAAYNNKVNKIRCLAAHNEDKKMLTINSESEEPGAYGVSEAEVSLVASQKDVYGEVDDRDELDHAVHELDRLALEICIVHQTAIWYCIKMALLGIPDAVNNLKRLVDHDPHVGELLRVVLSCGGTAVSKCLAQVG